MSSHEFAEPFERLLADACPPALVRAIERGALIPNNDELRP